MTDWLRFLGGEGERGLGWTVDDPRAAELAHPLHARVDAVLGYEPVFGDLAGHPGLVERVRHWHRRLVLEGTLGTLA